MKVLLLQDVEKLGKKYETKEVKDGYARNFLISRKLAKLATKEAVKWAEIQKEILAKKSEIELGSVQEVATRIDGLELPIVVKIGEEGQLFEKITAQKISEKMKEIGFDIKKNQIILGESIKEVGEYPIKIKLAHNLEAEIRVIITEEKI